MVTLSIFTEALPKFDWITSNKQNQKKYILHKTHATVRVAENTYKAVGRPTGFACLPSDQHVDGYLNHLQIRDLRCIS